MKYTRLLALIAAGTLAISGAMFAGTPAAQNQAKKVTAASSSMHGAVKSISDSQIVVTEKGKDLTFSLNSDTQKIGNIQSGSEVTVQFHYENGKDVATRVQASGTKKAMGK